MMYIDFNVSEVDCYLHPYVEWVNAFINHPRDSFTEAPKKEKVIKEILKAKTNELKCFFRNMFIFKWNVGYKVSWMEKCLVIQTINSLNNFSRIQIPCQTYIRGKLGNNKLYEEALIRFVYNDLKDYIVKLIKISTYKFIYDQNLKDIKINLYNLTRELIFNYINPLYTDVLLNKLGITEETASEILNPDKDTYPTVLEESNYQKDYENDLLNRKKNLEFLRVVLFKVFHYYPQTQDLGSPLYAELEDTISLSQPYTYDMTSRTVTPDDQCAYKMEFDGFQWYLSGESQDTTADHVNEYDTDLSEPTDECESPCDLRFNTANVSQTTVQPYDNLLSVSSQ
ncbi:unnamed protein product [Gordionus sp. m RMFG-2023]